jgi:hypothetical protein
MRVRSRACLRLVFDSETVAQQRRQQAAALQIGGCRGFTGHLNIRSLL